MKIKNLKAKAEKLIRTACMAFLTAVEPLSAYGVTVTVPTDLSMDSLVGKVIDVVLTLARYIGLILLIFGLYQLYLSFKDDNPDGKIKAITLLVTSVGLITLKSILKLVGLIS